MTADEHARLRPCRMMLRHYMLTVCGRRPHEQKMVHEVLACATSCVHISARECHVTVYTHVGCAWGLLATAAAATNKESYYHMCVSRFLGG